MPQTHQTNLKCNARSPAARRKRIIDLAIDLQFSSVSTFVGAFRQKFSSPK
jgi:AraC-like DNA-binding protein